MWQVVLLFASFNWMITVNVCYWYWWKIHGDIVNKATVILLTVSIHTIWFAQSWSKVHVWPFVCSRWQYIRLRVSRLPSSFTQGQSHCVDVIRHRQGLRMHQNSPVSMGCGLQMDFISLRVTSIKKEEPEKDGRIDAWLAGSEWDAEI